FLLALVLFRIVWGLMGSDTARFSRFVKSPVHALGHLKELGSRAPAWHVGHNPLGAWMVVALLLTVLVQAVTGLFASDDIMVEGPLYGLVSSAFSGRMTGLHHQVFNLLLLLVVLHVAAVLFYRFYKGTNLIRAMVTGNAEGAQGEAPALRSGWLGLGVFLACYGVVWGTLAWLG
ncbi:MAG: cytochrome b/b6 domain-containing protein, partial [Thiothrix sp.]|nr:cytochrome b/b6 domain-containing protein [Thiothrix sp.]